MAKFENYDSFYYEYNTAPPSYSGVYTTNVTFDNYGRSSYYLAKTPISDLIRDLSQKIDQQQMRDKLKELSEEKKEKMANDAAQAEIDEAVREALEKPRREAEIAKRVAAITKIGTEDAHEDGTVLRWKREFSKKVYTYVAIRVDGKWYVTGSKMVSASGWTWDALVEWMTTGESLITDLEVAAPEWTTVL